METGNAIEGVGVDDALGKRLRAGPHGGAHRARTDIFFFPRSISVKLVPNATNGTEKLRCISVGFDLAANSADTGVHAPGCDELQVAPNRVE